MHNHRLNELEAAFNVSDRQLRDIAQEFERQMSAGLNGKTSSLAMLPSYLSPPSGKEKGLFCALDFGGTNVRAGLIELEAGTYRTIKQESVPLRTDTYNYIGAECSAEQLFDFIAELIARIAPTDINIALGHTFSFPCRQYDVNTASLLYWTKEIAVTGAVGKNITALLTGALIRRGLTNIIPTAIVNDTVTTLLTAAYTAPATVIGSICGTGHNTCYRASHHPFGKMPMYINIESGNFDGITLNKYDKLLDNNSNRPGCGLLEKTCSGRYLGELFRLVCLDLFPAHAFTGHIARVVTIPYAMDAAELAMLIAKPQDAIRRGYPPDSIAVLQKIAKLPARRSARLVSATYAAIINHIAPDNQPAIAIDGSLYEKMPHYAQDIDSTLQALLSPTITPVCRLIKNASGTGAAIAAGGERKEQITDNK